MHHHYEIGVVVGTIALRQPFGYLPRRYFRIDRCEARRRAIVGVRAPLDIVGRRALDEIETCVLNQVAVRVNTKIGLRVGLGRRRGLNV
jgi:hypothetical protein